MLRGVGEALKWTDVARIIDVGGEVRDAKDGRGGEHGGSASAVEAVREC